MVLARSEATRGRLSTFAAERATGLAERFAKALVAGLAAGSAAIAATAPAALAEQMPNGFARAVVGHGTLYETERGPRLYVYAGRVRSGPVSGGYLEEVFNGCAAFDSAAIAGGPEPVARHWFDASGELARSEWDGRFIAEYAPHGCLVTLGGCEGRVRYRGWLEDPADEEIYDFSNDARREGDRVIYDYAEFALTGATGVRGRRVARTSGWFEIGPGGQFGDGQSHSEREGEPPAPRWHRRLAGPAPVADICGGVS